LPWILLVDFCPADPLKLALPQPSNLVAHYAQRHGHKSRGRRETSPPEFGVGDAIANVPASDFVIYVQKGAFCDLQNTPKSVLAGVLPRPQLGELTTLPRLSSRLGGDTRHPFPYPIPLGTTPSSALAMSPPRVPARSTPMLSTIMIMMTTMTWVL